MKGLIIFRMKEPTPEQIKQARIAADLTQTQAAAMIYTALNTWAQWEHGKRKMHPAFFELFLRKTGQRY
jgi:DNA-binding transcriptional regulator YiaG